MLNLLSRLIYPSLCQSCSAIVDQGQVFCSLCQSRVEPIVPVFLPLSKKYIIKVYAVCAYKDPVSDLILKKFSGNPLACRHLADLMTKFISFDTIAPDFLIPVPLHWTRYAWRGYNQSELIAKRLGNKLNVSVLNLVKRTRKTVFQSRLDTISRQKNVEQAFMLKSKFINTDVIKNKNIVIVDDLFTTGATVKNVARVLSELQPASISVAVSCRAV
jgi:competence protein ComFC